MARFKYSILSAGLFFVTLGAQAIPAGTPQDYNLKTTYSCQANGVSIHSQNKLISRGDSLREVVYTAAAGTNQALSLNGRQYMIWPRVSKGTFEKSLNVLAKDSGQKYQIMQEIDLGDSQKTKTNVGVTVRDQKSGEEKLVTCKVELEWLKKVRN
jgi:hypothetical protein